MLSTNSCNHTCSHIALDLPSPSHFDKDRATIVATSTIRAQYPYSLSYHTYSLSCVSSMTIVDNASTIPDRESDLRYHTKCMHTAEPGELIGAKLPQSCHQKTDFSEWLTHR
jgi:hypothetical protein